MEDERKDIIEETTDEVEVDEEEIEFPEYYTTTLVGSTTLLCVDEKTGNVIPRTLDDIAMAEDPGDIFVYSVDKTRSEIITSEIDLIIPEEDEKKVYKITFTNGLELACGGTTHLLMCNDIWYPVSSIEAKDYSLGIKFNQTEDMASETTGVIVPTVLEIKSVEKIANNTEHTYGILSENCNILIPKVLSDNEIAFAIVQQ